MHTRGSSPFFPPEPGVNSTQARKYPSTLNDVAYHFRKPTARIGGGHWLISYASLVQGHESHQDQDQDQRVDPAVGSVCVQSASTLVYT